MFPPTPTPFTPPIYFLAGIFDLFHFGHARALEQAKKLFPHTFLVVGVCNDKDTNLYKGKTVMTEDERYESLRHCKWVDQVLPNAPWVITAEFLDAHDIDYVAHDALPYADATGQTDDVYGPVKKMGRFKETQRTDGVSTSDLILRIIKDYNDYVLRNLSRGYSREELGLSLLKERRIRAGASIKNLSAKMKAQRKQVADRIRKHVTVAGSKIVPKIPVDEVEKNVQGFASTVETLVDKVMSGELGGELVQNMDHLVTGFIGSFEKSYQKLEKKITSAIGRVRISPLSKKKMKGRGEKRKHHQHHGNGNDVAIAAVAAAVAAAAAKKKKLGKREEEEEELEDEDDVKKGKGKGKGQRPVSGNTRRMKTAVVGASLLAC